MQKLITRYGTAAHLAILAVAPLFLSPTAVLWLSLMAAAWVLMFPSLLAVDNGSFSAARKRITKGIFCDPVFTVSVVVAILAGIRFFNNGVRMAYDLEAGIWSIADPAMSIMPGSVDGFGYLEFAVAVALIVLLAGCRHALGKSARFAFLIIASSLAGLGAVVMAILASKAPESVVAYFSCPITQASYFGGIFGVFLVCGTLGILFAFERQWYCAIAATVAFAIGGNVAGLFLFAPAWTCVAFAVVTLIIFSYSFFYAIKVLPRAGEFKYLVVFALALVAGVMLSFAVIPNKMFDDKCRPFSTGEFFPEHYFEMRSTLSNISSKVWQSKPWTGQGLGSFKMALNFNATEDDWFVLAPKQATALNGFWQLLCERGILGVAMIVALFGFLFFTYFHRLAVGITKGFPHPSCWAGLLVAIIYFANALVDCSFLIPSFMVSVLLLLIISSRSFPKENK